MDDAPGARGGRPSEGVAKASSAVPRAARTFDEAEVARILKTAAELHESSGAVVPRPGRGLSLEDLREVAEEAGIDPRFVDIAVSREGGAVQRGSAWGRGAPSRWLVSSEVPVELTEDERRRLVPALRSIMDHEGEVNEVLGRLEWRHNGDELGAVTVSVGSADGTTDIDVSANRNGEVGLMFGLGVPFGGLLGGAGIVDLLGLADTGPITLVAALAMGGVSWAALRFGWRFRSRWWERRLQEKAVRLSEAVERLAGPSALSPGGDDKQD